MSRKCTSCSENGLLYNDEQRCEICCYCGTVGETNFVSGSSAGFNEATGVFVDSETTTKFRVGKRGVRKGLCTTTNSNGTMGKTAVLGKEMLERLLSTYEVSSTAQEEAVLLYKQCSRKGFQFREARALAGAVLMAILRREKSTVTFREVAVICSSSVRDVGKQFKMVNRILIEKGDIAPLQPSHDDVIRNSIEKYAAKITKDLKVAQVVTKALALSEWIDECTLLQRVPAHLFALTVFYISFKSVNVDTHYDICINDFNSSYGFFPPNSFNIPAYNKISPKSVTDVICNVVNMRAGPSMSLTHTSIYFLLDMVLELKSHLKFKVSEEMKSVEGDLAFEQFKAIKDEQVVLEAREEANDRESENVNIPDSEVDEYIRSDKEVKTLQRFLTKKEILNEVS